MVQHQLGMTQGFAFDIQAVCAGFIYALANANALITSGQANRVLVIGAETFSKIIRLVRQNNLRTFWRWRWSFNSRGSRWEWGTVR